MIWTKNKVITKMKITIQILAKEREVKSQGTEIKVMMTK